EAFIEYYTRIETADKNFTSYTEGWRTDKGMVYVIYGTPHNIERYQGYGTQKIYEKWIYLNNREFVFEDSSGFGNFRLIRPFTVTEKYEYDR
ncbi:MAG: GWxTD domain-containing protein, partial [Bacteroidota bacterium]